MHSGVKAVACLAVCPSNAVRHNGDHAEDTLADCQNLRWLPRLDLQGLHNAQWQSGNCKRNSDYARAASKWLSGSGGLSSTAAHPASRLPAHAGKGTTTPKP